MLFPLLPSDAPLEVDGGVDAYEVPPENAPEPARKRDSFASDSIVFPSFLLQPGGGVRLVDDRTLGAAVFGMAWGGFVYFRKSYEVVGALGFHIGYSFTPRANRADLTLTGGLPVGNGWMISLRPGATLDTSGTLGLRAGVLTSLYEVFGLEVQAHHSFAPYDETSVLLLLSVDVIPIVVAGVLAGAITR